jgi:benzoyl-CoA reductase/2-hydroxyglutaryl-CoA dehydratase subunit BcrC/BadD/HgdB
MSETNKSRMGSIVRACRILGRMSKNDQDVHQSELYHYELLATYFERLQKAEENGWPIAAHTVFFPIEILYAMDITPLHTETVTVLTSLFLGNPGDYLAAGSELKMAPEICSPHRALAGAYSLGIFPRPSVMLWSNLICDNSAKSGELIAAMNRCPGFFLDHPFSNSPGEAQYLVEEMRDMIAFLEKQTGHKMDWNKLSESVARADHELQLLHEICELRKAVPSPLYNRAYLESRMADQLFAGQPEASVYLELMRDELKNLVGRGQGAVEPERFRIMSLFIPPMHLIGFLDRTLKAHGAVSVVEPFFTFWEECRLDPSRPLESLAKKYYSSPERRTLYGPLGDNTIHTLVNSAREYGVDGAIYYAFIGCRQSNALIKLVKDELNKIDVPVLTLDIDLIDTTINNESEIQQKMEQFFELLEDR